MKFSLTVLSTGAMQGKNIPVSLNQFLIGRGQECNLRPGNPIISKRHCALITRGNKIFVRDFASTNGTYVNNEAVKEEREVKDGDKLNVGPLAFQINIEKVPSVSEPTPVPVSKQVAAVRPSNGKSDDDEAAALLLSMHDDEISSGLLTEREQREGADLTGSTIVESLQNVDTDPHAPVKTGGEKREEAAKAASADTSAAAKVILDKYLRRPRG